MQKKALLMIATLTLTSFCSAVANSHEVIYETVRADNAPHALSPGR